MTIDRSELIWVNGGIDWMATSEKTLQFGASGAIIGATALPVFPPVTAPVGGAIGAVVGAAIGFGFGVYATWDQKTRR